MAVNEPITRACSLYDNISRYDTNHLISQNTKSEHSIIINDDSSGHNVVFKGYYLESVNIEEDDKAWPGIIIAILSRNEALKCKTLGALIVC